MKRIAAVLFALIISVGFALTFAACGDNGSISEVGKTYSVKDYKTDVNFVFDDPSKAPADLDSQKLAYSTMRISFKEKQRRKFVFACRNAGGRLAFLCDKFRKPR